MTRYSVEIGTVLLNEPSAWDQICFGILCSALDDRFLPTFLDYKISLTQRRKHEIPQSPVCLFNAVYV